MLADKIEEMKLSKTADNVEVNNEQLLNVNLFFIKFSL